MDKLKLTGQTLGRVFNSRRVCMHAMHLQSNVAIRPNLHLKTRLRQLLGSLPLDIALPDRSNNTNQGRLAGPPSSLFKWDVYDWLQHWVHRKLVGLNTPKGWGTWSKGQNMKKKTILKSWLISYFEKILQQIFHQGILTEREGSVHLPSSLR